MKNQMLKSTGLACLIATVLAAVPLSALAQTTQPTTPAVVAPQPDTSKVSKNVSGKVEAKSDTTLTVGGRTVSTGSSTTFSKAGASIGSGDVKVGDIPCHTMNGTLAAREGSISLVRYQPPTWL